MLELLLVTSKDRPLQELASALSGHEEIDLSRSDSGKAALDRVSKTLYDLVIVDEKLPDMTGLELVEKVVHVNAMINCAAISPLSPEEFHEAGEGLGIIAQLPTHPDRRHADALLKQLKTIKGLSGRAS